MLLIGAFFSYFIILFIIGRFISLISKVKRDAVVDIIFSIIVVS